MTKVNKTSLIKRARQIWRDIVFPRTRRIPMGHYRIVPSPSSFEQELYKEWIRVPVIALFLAVLLYTQVVVGHS